MDSTAAASSAEEKQAVPAADDLAAAKTVIRRNSGGVAGGLVGSPVEIARVLQGHLLNHFELQELIGGGGMGAVFRAQDTRLERTVAIKVIPRVGEDPDLLRRFRNEAQSAAKLDHPNIARVYDVGRHEDWHYIVFEFIEGTNVRDLVARSGVLSIDHAVFFIRQVAEALEHAYHRGVVHRDIKPSNVLIRPDGHVKLVDMGLARLMQLEVSADMTASGVTLGTFDYISPEQARDPRDADVRSDIYSLGCTLYYMLTGQPPYPGGTVLQKMLSHGSSPPPDPRDYRSDLSEDLIAILHKMLAKRPADRYSRPLDLIADLAELARRENLIKAQGLGTVSVPVGGSWQKSVERHLPWMVAAVALLISVGWLYVLSQVSADNALPPTSAAASAPRAAARGQSEATAADLPLEQQSVLPADAAGNAKPSGGQQSAAEPLVALPVPPELSDAATGLERQTVSSAQRGMPVAENAPAPTKIRVGGEEAAADDELVTNDLTNAINLAVQHGINRIEIAERHVVTGPLVIEKSGLVISAREPGCQLRFENSPLLTMEHAVMVNVGKSRVRFENVQFVWKVPSNAIYGGALFQVEASRGVQLDNCVLTVDNSSGREPVSAFQIHAYGANDASNGTDTTGPPPLVALELNNVIARGQMTLIRMDVAAQLQLRWENGLLAVSERMLETAGALRTPVAGRIQIKLALRDVTASIPKGLVAVNLGPSGNVPIVIDRDCSNCVFTTAEGGAHVSVNGVPEMRGGPYVILSGVGNHYDSEPGRSDQIVAIKDTEGDLQAFRLIDLAESEPPSWMREQSPQSFVYWSALTPPDDKPSHQLVPADFSQDGTVLPGFVEIRLPALLEPLPAEPENRPSI